ncbi:MAG: hypothetical protein ACI8QG_000140, partial [Flavobacteriales bacterium]
KYYTYKGVSGLFTITEKALISVCSYFLHIRVKTTLQK